LKAPQVEPEPFIVHVDSAQKIITTITSNNLQKNVTDTNATIALESENGANIDYIFCEDITENIEDNEKLQLTYDKDTQVLTAISVDSNNVATGEHKIKISSLLSPK
jgi:predicted RNA-binding protein (virulence factor B family)